MSHDENLKHPPFIPFYPLFSLSSNWCTPHWLSPFLTGTQHPFFYFHRFSLSLFQFSLPWFSLPLDFSLSSVFRHSQSLSVPWCTKMWLWTTGQTYHSARKELSGQRCVASNVFAFNFIGRVSRTRNRIFRGMKMSISAAHSKPQCLKYCCTCLSPQVFTSGSRTGIWEIYMQKYSIHVLSIN